MGIVKGVDFMAKIAFLWKITDSVFLIIFNIIFFVLGGGDRSVSTWISYVFIHLAYFMLIATPYMNPNSRNTVVLGLSLYAVSATYFLIELIVGTAFILASPEGYKMALIVQLCVFGLYAVVLISNMVANEHTIEAQGNRQHQIDYIKNATAEMSLIVDSISDRNTKKKVEKVLDAITSSPAKSYPNLSPLESQIWGAIINLKNAVAENREEIIIVQAETLLATVNERSRQLRLLH